MDIKEFSPILKDRYEHLNYAFNKCEVGGDILEFGVFKGKTINHIATLTNKNISGFDSFESLPEPWDQGGGRQIEYTERFKVDKIPEVACNVQLYKGWFKDTIPDWKHHNSNPIQFLHIDSDLYSSCKTVLTELNHLIVKGTIIVFDEMFGYPNYKQHEWKACLEWLKEYKREITPLARTTKYAASVKVIK